MTFKVLKEKKNCQPRMLYLAKLSFKDKGEIKSYPDKEKQRELVTSRLALQEILKKVLQAEMKRC